MGPTASLVAAAAIAAAALPSLAAAACAGTPTYRVTCRFNWTPSTHPRSYVPSAHFSPVTVAAHTPAYTMWLTNALATRGMKNVAETGSRGALRFELATYQRAGHVASVAGGRPGPVFPTSTRVVTVKMDGPAGATLLSASTMLVPSPDWFLGWSRVDLCNGTAWTDAAGGLGLWDAGTYSGATLTGADKETVPPTVIRRFGFGDYPLFGREFGTWSAKRVV